MPNDSSDVLCRIVHLSDLHVGTGFDRNLWGLVKARVPGLKPDILIVSGDFVETPRFASFRRARLLLEQLIEECHKSRPSTQDRGILITVPGNHDFAFYGNDVSPSVPLAIRWVAKPLVKGGLMFINILWARWVGRLGYAAYFERDAHKLSWIKRITKLYPQLLWTLLKGWIGAHFLFNLNNPADDRLSSVKRYAEKSGVLVVPFCSYSKAWFASGMVEPKEIFGLNAIMAEQKNTPGSHLRRRIAVVHHHPVPIPYTPDREGLTEFEPFLSFRNAGTFLRELFGYNFDLVLHGHRHISNFMRLNYNYRGDEGEIAILSTGSAALRTTEPNSFNVITIYRNGEVSLAQVPYGGGRGLHQIPEGIPLFSFQGRKKNAFRRSVEAQGFYFEQVSRSVRIDKHGTSFALLRFEKLKTVGPVEKCERPFRIQADQGCIYYIRPDKASGVKLEPSLGNPSRLYSGKVIFNRKVNESTQGFSYGIETRILSSHAMSQQQAQRMGRLPTAWSGYFVTIPIKSLEFQIKFPADFAVKNMRLEIDLCPAVLDAAISPEGEINLNQIDTSKRTRDVSLEGHERTYVKREDGNAWKMTIEYPIVGYVYRFVWDLPDEGLISLTDEWPRLTSEVQVFQTLLLSHRKARQNEQENEANKKVRALFVQLFDQLEKVFRTKLGQEQFSVDLMTFDSMAKRSEQLVRVEGLTRNQGSEIPSKWEFALEPGVGNSGHAYQTGMPILFIKDEANEESSYYVPSSSTVDYHVLASIPIWHPQLPDVLDKARAEEWHRVEGYAFPGIIGVLGIGSSSPASNLRRLKDPTEFAQLGALCQVAVEAMLHMLQTD